MDGQREMGENDADDRSAKRDRGDDKRGATLHECKQIDQCSSGMPTAW